MEGTVGLGWWGGGWRWMEGAGWTGWRVGWLGGRGGAGWTDAGLEALALSGCLAG